MSKKDQTNAPETFSSPFLWKRAEDDCVRCACWQGRWDESHSFCL